MNALDKVMTIREVAEEFHLNQKYLQIVLSKGKLLVEGRDCRKAGCVWLILRSAAARLWEYRKLPLPPAGFRFCRRCERLLPLDLIHFKPYSIRGTEGFTHTCRECLAILEAARFQRVKGQRRDKHRQYMREYRAANPGYNARAVRRYQQRKTMRAGAPDSTNAFSKPDTL